MGRYRLSNKIFDLLQETGKGTGDAISALLNEEDANAYKFDGIRYDCGSKEGLLEANIEYALKQPELKKGIRVYGSPE